MAASAEALVAAAPEPDVDPPVGEPVAFPRRPNLRGDLDSVLEFLPSFRAAVRGYDRWQVDSYVSWAERELRAARRSADEMAARFAACSAELQGARQQLDRSEEGRDALRVTDRMARMLELAGEEAAALTAAGATQAEQLVGRARTYAAAMLKRARDAQDAVAAETEVAARVHAEAADLLEHARTGATELLEHARIDAAELRAAAVAARERLDAEAGEVRARLDRESAARRAQLEERARQQRAQEAAAAAQELAVARREVDELHARQDRARASLQRLTDQIGEALQTLATSLPVEPPNIVAPQPVR